MVISVSENEWPLTELLYLRAAWQLEVDLPQTMGIVAARHPADPSLVMQWAREWRKALVWAAAERERSRRLNSEPLTAELMNELLLPRWTDADGEPFVEPEELAIWVGSLPTHLANSLAETPERMSVASLRGAWRRGLTTMMVVPLEGVFATTIAPNALLLSTASYWEPEHFRAALEQFDPDS